jgi:hypothetical protein
MAGCAEYAPHRALSVQAQSLVGNIKSIFGADVQCFTMKNPLPEVTGQTPQRTNTHASHKRTNTRTHDGPAGNRGKRARRASSGRRMPAHAGACVLQQCAGGPS